MDNEFLLKHTWAWGYSLVVEHLFSMCEALDSVLSIGKELRASL